MSKFFQLPPCSDRYGTTQDSLRAFSVCNRCECHIPLVRYRLRVDRELPHRCPAGMMIWLCAGFAAPCCSSASLPPLDPAHTLTSLLPVALCLPSTVPGVIVNVCSDRQYSQLTRDRVLSILGRHVTKRLMTDHVGRHREGRRHGISGTVTIIGTWTAGESSESLN